MKQQQGFVTALNLLWRAFWFTIRAHKGQYRKNPPWLWYVTHPFVVSLLVLVFAKVPRGERIHTMIVALLHDVVEEAADPQVMIERLKELFGTECLTDVLTLTNEQLMNMSGIQKAEHAARKLNAQAARVREIKRADKFHNLHLLPSSWNECKRASYLGGARVLCERMYQEGDGKVLRTLLHVRIRWVKWRHNISVVLDTA